MISLNNVLHNMTLILTDFLLICFLYFLVSYGTIYINFEISIFLVPSIIFIVFYYAQIYRYRYDFWQETKLIFRSIFISYLLVMMILLFLNNIKSFNIIDVTMYFFMLWFVLPIFKRIQKRIIYQLSFFKKNVNIIASQSDLELLENEFNQNWYLGIKYDSNDYNSVIIVSNNMAMEELQSSITKYLLSNAEVYIIPYISDINFANTNILEYNNIRLSLINIENKLANWHNIFIKKVFDVMFVVILLPVLLLLHIIISILIKLDSNGTILFVQPRLGRNNKIFDCYKYRTMYENGDIILEKYLSNNPQEVEYYNTYHKYKNDPRITRIGKLLRKTSLDELPQFINVLKFEMSLVGPRPYMLDELYKLDEKQDIISKVSPGITGLWQVSGRSNLSFDDRNKLDIWYIKNWSLWLDFVILLKTVKVVLFRKGAA